MDVTEQGRAEATLLELKAAVEQAIDGIAISDLAGVVRFVNRAWAEMHGEPPEAVVGRSLSTFHTAQQMRDDVQPHMEHLLSAGAHSGEVWHKRADGTPFLTFMSTSMLKDSAGKPCGMLAIARDITDRKRSEDEQRSLQAQLAEVQKMESIGRLAAGVAHDFNNYMFCLLGYAEMVLERLEAASPLRQHVEQMKNVAMQAADLTKQLLAFSRKQLIQPQPVDVDASVIKHQKILWRVLGEDIRIVLRLGARDVRAFVDPTQFQQVLMNLCVNARDAMPKGGDLIIQTAAVKAPTTSPPVGIEPGSPFVCVSVIDHGVGMSPEDRQRVFEPFFTSKQGGGGAGLGLPVVFGIVKQHGGWIDVQSELNAGSRFDVYLPVAESQPEERAEKAEPAIQGNGELILLVEDAAPVREIGSARLRALGYRVAEADGVESGWKAFLEAKGAVRILLSDVVLPAGTGVNLAERIAAADPSVIIVLSSGYADERIGITEIQRRHWTFLPKPYTRDQVGQMLHDLLQSRRSAG